MKVEPLGHHHGREGFDCGVASLNEYLRRYARQNDENNVGRTYVGVESAGDAHILGYYTLSSHSIERDRVPERRLPRYPVPAALIGRLAVDRRHQGRGLGEALLRDALRRCVRIAHEIAIYDVAVDALDERDAAWYQRYGFQPVVGEPLRLYLPTRTIWASVDQKG